MMLTDKGIHLEHHTIDRLWCVGYVVYEILHYKIAFVDWTHSEMFSPPLYLLFKQIPRIAY